MGKLLGTLFCNHICRLHLATRVLPSSLMVSDPSSPARLRGSRRAWSDPGGRPEMTILRRGVPEFDAIPILRAPSTATITERPTFSVNLPEWWTRRALGGLSLLGSTRRAARDPGGS